MGEMQKQKKYTERIMRVDIWEEDGRHGRK